MVCGNLTCATAAEAVMAVAAKAIAASLMTELIIPFLPWAALAGLARHDGSTWRNCAVFKLTREALPAPTIGRDALVGHPHPLRQPAGLPEHVDRDAAARIPVAADA